MLKPLHTFVTALLFLSATVATHAYADTPTDSVAADAEYDQLAARAARFFHYREWASAEAMYTLMIQKQPNRCDSYSHAIVAAGMLNDTLNTSRLTISALNARIPVDSLFSDIEKISFSIGRTSLYEKYLLFTQRDQPWLSRVIDTYLMRYYSYRRYGPGMVCYSLAILERLPDDIPALYSLAQGYLISGKTNEAIATYSHIVSLDPNAYLALLYLGNYYATHLDTGTDARAKAGIYLNQAHRLRPTPYTEKLLNTLRP